jgi:hypothetical protein
LAACGCLAKLIDQFQPAPFRPRYAWSFDGQRWIVQPSLPRFSPNERKSIERLSEVRDLNCDSLGIARSQRLGNELCQCRHVARAHATPHNFRGAEPKTV